MLSKLCLLTAASTQHVFWGLLLMFGSSPSAAAAAPRCSYWPQGPAAAERPHQWNRRPDTQEPNNPHVPPTGHARSGRHKRWHVLCRSRGRALDVVAWEPCEGEAGCCGCCCGSAPPPGCGCPPGSDCDHVLEEAGSCPCPLWGSRREENPGLPLPHCHGRCLGHTWGGGRWKKNVYKGKTKEGNPWVFYK